MPAWLLCVLGNPYCFSGSPSKGWIIIHRAISSDPVSIFECPLILDIVNSLFMKEETVAENGTVTEPSLRSHISKARSWDLEVSSADREQKSGLIFSGGQAAGPGDPA